MQPRILCTAAQTTLQACRTAFVRYHRASKCWRWRSALVRGGHNPVTSSVPCLSSARCVLPNAVCDPLCVSRLPCCCQQIMQAFATLLQLPHLSVASTIRALVRRLPMCAAKRRVLHAEPHHSLVLPSRVALDSFITLLEDGRHIELDLAGSVSVTRGFLPVCDQPTALPPSHAEWDGVAARLPSLWRCGKLRAAVAKLPLLRADEESLPNAWLPRAAVVVGMIAQA